jgi:hypothetical protein
MDNFDKQVTQETFDPEQIDCSVYPRPMICELNGN